MLTNIVRIVSQTVRKITYKILEVKKLILPGKETFEFVHVLRSEGCLRVICATVILI